MYRANQVFPKVNLLVRLILVFIDSAVGRGNSEAGTVPAHHSVFPNGSHLEFSKILGISPTVCSRIVGDVTIKLARLIDSLSPAGIHNGDFMASFRLALGLRGR